jgi:hypothetical protein
MSERVSGDVSVEGLSKHGEKFQFLISVPPQAKEAILPGSCISVNGKSVVVKNCDGEYASFELELGDLIDSVLAPLEVGSQVTITWETLKKSAL